MPNILDLYFNYIQTNDNSFLAELVFSKDVASIINLYNQLNFDQSRNCLTVDTDEIISELYIRLERRFKNTSFDKEYKLRAYLKDTVRGIILDYQTRIKDVTNTVLTQQDKLIELSESKNYVYDTYEAFTYSNELQAIFKAYPYIYDKLIDKDITYAELTEKYGVNKHTMSKHIKEYKPIIKEILSREYAI